ncbi:hypothetical protein BD779DRAFT_1439590 [Infundibulicybe gibba]|nr:hypothetical protein BD779DRAFT_1439590 [Infundibulicybe gibba]
MGFLLTPSKQVHALNPSSGFKQPPFDGSLTVPQIYDWHYHHNPQHPVFVYPNLGGGTSEIPFAELVPAAHRAGRYVVESMGLPMESQSFPLAAIIAHADTITYFTVILGMLRVAVPVFPINPYLPEPAFLHLISTNRPQHIFISDDATLTNLVQKALREMENKDPTYKPKYLNFLHSMIYL